jgi:hypothetical protein
MNITQSVRYLIIFLLFFSSCDKARKTKDGEDDSAKTESTIGKEAVTGIMSAKSLGMAYLEDNKLEEAETQFLKMIALAPEDASGYANLGVVYLRQGKNDEAEKYLQKAVDLDPGDPDIRLNLAKVYELRNDRKASLEELKKSEEITPDHVKTLYSIAEKYEGASDASSVAEWETYMRKIVENAPRNIVARLYLVEALTHNEKGDEALKNLEETQQICPQFPSESLDFFRQAMELLRSDKPREALTPILIFHNFLKLTPEYQGGIRELKGTQNATVGVPVISFTDNKSLALHEGESIIDMMKFTDATSGAGLDVLHPGDSDGPSPIISNIAVGDMDGDGDYDLYYSGYNVNDKKPFRLLLRSEFGRYEDITENSGIDHIGNDNSSVFVDYDNDGFLDLYVCNSVADVIYRNVSEGVFENATAKAGIKGSSLKPLFLDIDHEGDLDVIVSREGINSAFRNNGDGTFSILAESSGLISDSYRSSDLSFADFDEDGDIDIAITNADGPFQLFSNLRQGRFIDVIGECGIQIETGSAVVEAADFDNDGYFDLLISSMEGRLRLFRNKGDGTFIESGLSDQLSGMLAGMQVHDVVVFDFDNDGYSDILIAGDGASTGCLILLRNEGDKYSDASSLLPPDIPGIRRVALADYNQDGDLDIFMVDINGKLKLLRNDGGNANHHLKVKLVGLRTGSGKNNYFGIGSTVEVRAGDLFIKKLITQPDTHFGLGNREKADVVRIVWTNGVPQNIFSPGSDQDLIEEQDLKGSCPFLYTWNGEEYVFVKDMMWRSALGMPLGIMGGKAAYAFADASEEYLKIPGEMLLEKDGKYTIRITEELWETIYADEIRLIAVDHPAEAEIYVDEKFSAPPYPELKVYKVKKHQLPVSATDGKGNDLLALISQKDNEYIANFQRDRYQGITEMKDLVLDLGETEDTKDLHLFLNGWIFPTDASINVAISQSEAIRIQHPSLEVINARGEWQEVLPGIGFPSGKNKTVIVDLSDKFLTKDRRVRIRTNMEIYWDYIFFARDEDMETDMMTMHPESADHHYRGFSARSRNGGRYGPHWFDYQDVSTDRKWRDLTGTYTRYGDVTELLQESDDMYIIANAGDETTISFDAAKLPELKQGWKRDFLIYSVGWVKDGDLNTALGQTVEPLPFHGMSRYPYGPEEHYPTDQKHREYQQKYNTREVGTKDYQEVVRGGK